MDNVLLIETAQPATKTASGRWRAILATPGQGSSGFYPAETLKRYGPLAFPAGTKAYLTHESRHPRDILGSYPEGAFWDAEEGTDGALVAELQVRPSMQEFAEEVAPLTGLSIYSMGKLNESGHVTEMIHDRSNSVDLVGEAGLEGSGLVNQISEAAMALLEQARTAASADEREEESMTPEDFQAALAEALAPVLAFISEQTQAAEAAEAARAAEAGDEGDLSVEEAVEAFATASDSIKSAELLPTQEAALIARAKKGEDITAALEEAKAIKAEAITTLTEARPNVAGGRRQDAGSDGFNSTLGLEWK